MLRNPSEAEKALKQWGCSVMISILGSGPALDHEFTMFFIQTYDSKAEPDQ